MDVEVVPKKKVGQLWDVDAFCGPCWHKAQEHTPTGTRTYPLCWECPGSKSDYDSNDAYAGAAPAWWDRPDGDPSLEGFVCGECPQGRQPEPRPNVVKEAKAE